MNRNITKRKKKKCIQKRYKDIYFIISAEDQNKMINEKDTRVRVEWLILQSTVANCSKFYLKLKS